jgi:receptor expression-enhancing protein 1/2/3/4
MQYEPNIEHRLLHLRAKSGQLLNFYAKNFADKGTAFFMDVLRYVVSDKAEGSNLEVMASPLSMQHALYLTFILHVIMFE